MGQTAAFGTPMQRGASGGTFAATNSVPGMISKSPGSANFGGY